MWWYKGDLKAKSTVKDSHVDWGVGPGLKSQVESKWSKSVLSYTREMIWAGGERCTCEVYLHVTRVLRQAIPKCRQSWEKRLYL